MILNTDTFIGSGLFGKVFNIDTFKYFLFLNVFELLKLNT